MKIASAAVTLLASTLPTLPRSIAEQCVSGSFFIEFEGACTPEAVLEAYEDQVYDAVGATTEACSSNARADLEAKLAEAGMDLDALCKRVYDDQEKIPFTDAANRGEDLLFERMFYNGRTDWQEEVETTHETEDGAATSILAEDAEQVKAFYRGIAQGRRVEWPGALENFRSGVADGDGLATCATNAAMCCWPKDRQAGDNNGNCASPYDEDCVDKDPADNTNLCYVDADRGNQSTGLDVGEAAFVYTPGDNDHGEGAIHCHGLAWSNDVKHHTARYKANNMFYVSMYDHMYQRGYVKNIPGAPMCGCVEQMPTVTRSDCTQVDLTETIEISYNAEAKAFKTTLASVHVDFNSCRGINHRNNDLWAYIARLYYEGHVTPKQFGEAGRIITDSGCREATRFHLNEIGWTPGYDHDVAVWTNVAGRESMKLHDYYGHRSFVRSLTPAVNADGTPDHYGIIYRACQSCIRTHKKIFYRRISPIPDDFDLLYNILYEGNDGDGNNVWSEDFSLHSSHHDAVNDLNPWKCPDDEFEYRYTFYGRCSPDGTRVNDQRSRFDEWDDRQDVAYFANKAEDDRLEILPTTAIEGRDRAGGIALVEREEGGAIYMTGSGRDIYNWWDDFNYMGRPASGDVTVVVHAGPISSPDPHDWSKSGIMLRRTLDPRSAHYSLLLTGGNGVCPQARLEDMTYPKGWDCVNDGATEAWLKVEKRADVLTSFVGYQLGDEPIQWEPVDSREVPGIGDEYLVGLAVCSAREEAQEVVFRGYQVDEYNWPSASPSLSSAPTVWSTNILVDAGNNGKPPEAFPLGECEGDCDSDSDCEGDLKCYQRNGYEAVPGCSGSGLGTKGSDYCAKRPTQNTLFLPRSGTEECDGNCQSHDSCAGNMLCDPPVDGAVPGCVGLAVDVKYCHHPEIVTLDAAAGPLGLCEGACDSDADCKGALECFLRTDAEPVPGCAGEGVPGAGYCADRPRNHLWTKAEGGSPVDAFPLGACDGDCGTDFDCEGHLICEHRSGDEEVPGCGGAGRTGVSYCRYPKLIYLGNNNYPPESFPLQVCEGDCDGDDECADGLQCFQRAGNAEVGGCAGEGTWGTDYCAVRATETTLFMTGSNGDVMGLCEGDCDNDSECEGDLVCFKRDGYEEVYGCEGDGASGEDYCHPKPPPGPGSCIPDPETCGCEENGAEDYRGNVAVTVKGTTCQAWDSQEPHAHNRTPQAYPSSGLEGNYCRNPDGEPGAWCYTTDPNTRWDWCDVPTCPTIPDDR